MLGALSVFRRLPSGSRITNPKQLRFHPRVAGFLLESLLRTECRAAGLFWETVMIHAPVVKLLPRNVAALRKGQDAQAGTRNCFPGLECDLRNLERRFFPCLEVDVTLNEISVVAVDLAAAPAAVKSGYLSKRSLPVLKRIDASLRSGQTWQVDVLHGDLG